MQDTNRVLRAIMQEHGLTFAQVARELDVSEATVEVWAAEDGAGVENMPETELRLLQYALMTENKRWHLF